MLNGHRYGAVTLKGQTAGQHFIEHHTGRINVRACVDTVAAGLFR